jgi:hypothetical protein
MNHYKIKNQNSHTYKVIFEHPTVGNQTFPTVNMEISSEANIADHLYAFERFLESMGYVLPEKASIDFVQEEIESRDDITTDDSIDEMNGLN